MSAEKPIDPITEVIELEAARKRHDEAAAAYLEASAAYEAALMSTGAARESDAAEHFRRAGNESAAALQALVRARKTQAPGFEALLTDPAMQVDPDGEVLDSIRVYSAALPASAGMPLATARAALASPAPAPHAEEGQ